MVNVIHKSVSLKSISTGDYQILKSEVIQREEETRNMQEGQVVRSQYRVLWKARFQFHVKHLLPSW